MQFRLLPAFVLFIGSYFPLALILLVQDIPGARWKQQLCFGLRQDLVCTYQVFAHPWPALTMVLITFCALVGTLYAFGRVPLRFDVEVIEVKAVPNDLINYVFPYVVSFMGLDYSEPGRLAGFAVFLALMFVVTYKSGQIVMNPLLIMFGWRLYEVTMLIGTNSKSGRALKRGRLQLGAQRMEAVQDFYFVGDT